MKKKGFTLVELLAVIAILAILVIIALPNVMGMFNEAKKNSFTTEVKQIFKTAQQKWISESMFNTSDKVYSRCKNGCSNALDLTGRTELEYCIKIDKSGNVKEYYATDGTYQYIYNGGSLSIEEIKDIQSVEDNNLELTCNGIEVPLPSGDPALGNIFNPNKDKYYSTLVQAFNDIGSNETIRLLNDITEANGVNVPSGKSSIKLDLNGKVLTLSRYTGITNNSELTVINSSTTQATIDNTGSGTNGIIFNNNGKLILNSSSSNKNIILKKDDYTTSLINNNESAELIINSNTSIDGGDTTIDNKGTLNITGGTINGGFVIRNSDSGFTRISGSSTQIKSNKGISNKGNLIIDDGFISASNNPVIVNNGTATINGGTLKCSTYSSHGIVNRGTLTVTNGHIIAYRDVISNYSVFTSGTNDSNVNISSPIYESTSKNVGGYTGYGVDNTSSGTFNFYDGVIKAHSGSGYSINGSITNKPNNYVLHTELIDGVENSYLVLP